MVALRPTRGDSIFNGYNTRYHVQIRLCKMCLPVLWQVSAVSLRLRIPDLSGNVQIIHSVQNLVVLAPSILHDNAGGAAIEYRTTNCLTLHIEYFEPDMYRFLQ
jgi:hypothetical protein